MDLFPLIDNTQYTVKHASNQCDNSDVTQVT